MASEPSSMTRLDDSYPSSRVARAVSACLVLLTAAVWSSPAPALAFMCSRVVDKTGGETGSSLSWMTRSITYSLQQSGTTRISGRATSGELVEHQVLIDSFAVWTALVGDSGGSCPKGSGTDLEFIKATALSQSTQIGYDFLYPERNENLLVFRDDTWPYEGASGADIIGLTTTTYDSTTGEILDADIEFNSFRFDFSTNPANQNQTDLMNTAVHEIGHFLGLGHTTAQQPDTTMFGQATQAETKKRTLDCDDVRAILFKYPSDRDNGYCSPPVSACGYCAPPDQLDTDVDVSVADSSDGLDQGCNCANANSGYSGACCALIALFVVVQRRSRARTRSLVDRAAPTA